MCGFIVKYNLAGSNPSKNSFNETSISLLRRRGPDETSLYCDNFTAISFSRLKVRGLEVGNQPFKTKDGFLGVGNGEIYNSDDIFLELNADQQLNLHPNSDIHIALEYLSRSNFESVANLEGMFALVLVNDQGDFLLARDKAGQKPLYYCISPSEILISSNLESIIIEKSGLLSLNEQSVQDWMRFGLTMPGETLISEIKEVKPGHVVKISSGHVFETKYWQWPTRGKISLDSTKVKSSLNLAVKRTTISEVGYSLAFSGGADSSAILQSIEELANDPVLTISLGFRNSSYDELDSINNWLKTSSHNSVVLHFEDYINPNMCDSIIDLMDEPISDPACLPFYLICTSAVSHGAKVLITGDGGDESTRGYKAFKFEFLCNIAWRVMCIVSKDLRRRLITFILNQHDSRYLSATNLLSRFLIASLFKANLRWPIALSPNYYLAYLMHEKDSESLHFSRGRDLEKYFQDFILPQIYLRKTDRISMGLGLEVRAPFLDSQLIKLLMDADSRRGGKGVRSLYPSQIHQKSKRGLGVPLKFVISQIEEPTWHIRIPGMSETDLSEIWAKRTSHSTAETQAAWSLYVLNRKMEKWSKWLKTSSVFPCKNGP